MVLSQSQIEKTKYCLFVIVVAYQGAFASILPLLPFVNSYLHLNGLQFALAFSSYSFTMMISSLCYGTVSDYIGRRKTIILAFGGLTIGSLICFTTSNITVYLLGRAFAGAFDAIIVLAQSYIADIVPLRDRPKYFSQLENVNNISQCLGPFIGGFLSMINLYVPLYIDIGLYFFGFLYSIFFLPETVMSVIEKKKILASFSVVDDYHLEEARTPQENQTALLDYEESKRIQEEFLKGISEEERMKRKNSKLRFNYLMILSLIGEFCNKWGFTVFDTIVCIYGEDHFGIDTFTYSMMSSSGSFFNALQSGFLYNYLLKKDFSIPMIASWGGISFTIAYILCVLHNKICFIIGGVAVIMSYGFAAQLAPNVMSAESNDITRGKAISTIIIGGMGARILNPLVLNNVYPNNSNAPFYISMLPSISLFILMQICHHLPGGKFAGQVALKDSLQFDKDSKIMEMEGSEGNLKSVYEIDLPISSSVELASIENHK